MAAVIIFYYIQISMIVNKRNRILYFRKYRHYYTYTCLTCAMIVFLKFCTTEKCEFLSTSYPCGGHISVVGFQLLGLLFQHAMLQLWCCIFFVTLSCVKINDLNNCLKKKFKFFLSRMKLFRVGLPCIACCETLKLRYLIVDRTVLKKANLILRIISYGVLCYKINMW